MFGWLLLVLLLLCVVAVSNWGGGFMAGGLLGYVQGHGGCAYALYGEPQCHANQ